MGRTHRTLHFGTLICTSKRGTQYKMIFSYRIDHSQPWSIIMDRYAVYRRLHKQRQADCQTCVDSGHCGYGARASRHVGRCESDTLETIAGCNEGSGGNLSGTQIVPVIRPDDSDNPCVDIYTSQVVRYEGYYIAFPGAYEHFPEPPSWPFSNDGWRVFSQSTHCHSFDCL